MKVFTSKEYKEYKESELSKRDSLDSFSKPIKKKVNKEYKFWRLFHPENGVDDLQNFEDEINIDGKIYKRICKNGVVTTEHEILAEFLINKGYMVIEKLNNEPNQSNGWINELKDNQ